MIERVFEMLKQLTWTLCLSAILGLSACGEQKANSVNNAPVGLMSEQSKNNQQDENVESNQKSKSKKEVAPWSGQAVDINTASATELQAALKGTGVGKAKVEKIIEYREQHGGFKSIEELTAVKGIGDKTMEKVRERVTVSGTSQTAAKKVKVEEKQSDTNKETQENDDE